MRMKLEKPWSNALLFMGITIAVYLSMKYLLPIVFPFFLAAILAILLHGIVDKIQNRIRLPRSMISFLVLVLAILLIGIPLLLLLWQLIKQICSLVGGYSTWKGEIAGIWYNCCSRIEALIGIKAELIQEWGNNRMNGVMETLQEKVVPFLMSFSLNSLKQLAGFFWKLIVTVIATQLMLSDYDNIRIRIMKTSVGDFLQHLSIDTKRAGGMYLKAQFIILLIISGICVVGLFLTGNSYALLAGIGIGLCDALPFIGTGIIFVPWLIIKLFQGEYWMALIYGVMYIICNLTREFLEPKLVGKKLGIHPLFVIFSIYVGISMFGMFGVILGPVSGLLIWEIYMMCKVR